MAEGYALTLSRVFDFLSAQIKEPGGSAGFLLCRNYNSGIALAFRQATKTNQSHQGRLFTAVPASPRFMKRPELMDASTRRFVEALLSPPPRDNWSRKLKATPLRTRANRSAAFQDSPFALCLRLCFSPLRRSPRLRSVGSSYNPHEGAALRGGGACSKHRPSSHPHGAACAVSATVSRKSDRPST